MSETTDTAATTVSHGSFTLEYTYPAPPQRVFRAFADQSAKARWFASPDQVGDASWEFDFRVGGSETNHFVYTAEQVEGTPLPEGTTGTFHATYFDIVEDRRIVLAYEMIINGTRISVSLQTIELAAIDGGTRLTLTEHGAFLEDADGVEIREHGTRELLTALGATLDD
jgi:uncharacterized protein YndB with AHSA1/START domain